MTDWPDDLDPGSLTGHAMRALHWQAQWPFPPPTGPVPWTAADEREYAKQQREQAPEAPL
jgi:hypothetical protein